MTALRPLCLAALGAALLFGGEAHASASVDRPIKTLINAVRYSKDTLALGHLDGEAQGRYLLEEEWAKGSDAQRKEFIDLFHKLFAAIAFPQIRDNFKHLETTLYEPPKITGETAEVLSTIVILHALKKQEMKIKYDLRRHKDSWKVVDVTVLGGGGSSFLADIRNGQIRPIFAQGGWDHLLSLMRQRLEQVQPKGG